MLVENNHSMNMQAEPKAELKTEPKAEPKPIDPLEGPIKWTVCGLNFTLSANVDTAESKELSNWMTNRLMYQWRKLVIFNKIEATLIGATAVDENQSTAIKKKKDSERDAYLKELTGDWLLLENVLVASALKITDPKHSQWIKSIPGLEKLKIINLQDRLNGFDVIQKMMEIKNFHDSAKRVQDLQEKQAEERAKQILEENKEKSVSPVSSKPRGSKNNAKSTRSSKSSGSPIREE